MDRGCRCQDRLHRGGSPWENGYIESFNACLRDELLNSEIFYTLREAQIIIERPNRIKATCTRGVRACTRHVGGCATPAPPPTLAQRPTLN
jgi:transposase InsO family protein